MPLPTTIDAFRSILKADPTVAPRERSAIIATMRDAAQPTQPTGKTHGRVMRRLDVAKTLGRSLRTVDMMAAEGLLRRVTLPGRTRACGFLAEDVEALLRDCVAA